jgi:hypothetical protein
MLMRGIPYFLSFALLLCCASSAFGARVLSGPISVDVPENWQSTRAVQREIPKALAAVLECVDEDPAHLLLVGWKQQGQLVQAGLCVSYWGKGGEKTLNLLKGPDKEDAFGKFADIFASKITTGYQKRKALIQDLSATLLDANDMVLTTIDGQINIAGKEYMRSDTVFLKGNAIVNVSTMYDLSADGAGQQAEGIPLSLEWR